MGVRIMTFHITINKSEITRLESKNAGVVFIPFTGTVDSPYFKGTVMPGAADVQITDASGLRHMCAKYIFEGTDAEGKHCHLFVENNGYFPRDMVQKEYFAAVPHFISDSEYLNDILSRPVFRSEGHPSDSGVDILIFDESKDEEDLPEEPVTEDPLLMQLLENNDEDEQILREAGRLYEEEKIRKLIFFSSHEGRTFTVDHPAQKLIAAVLNDLRGSAQMLFMINEKNQLAALSYISGRIRNIDDSVLNVYAEIFSQTGQDRYFEQPINRYPRMRINEI